MINAIIIDDEPFNIYNLEQLILKNCPEVNVAGTASNAEDGQRIILQINPELVLLDIQMPGKNGFDLLKSLPQYWFEVIFITAYDQFGIQAVKFAAIDYLLKPINIEELKIAIQKVTNKSVQKRKNLQLENLIELLNKKQNQEEHRVALPTTHEIRFVNPKDIVRCESSNNYTTFYLQNNDTLLISKPIYFYEDLLKDYGFVRCHQSHLVNKKFIKSFVKEDGGYLLLENTVQLPVSKQKKESIKEMFSKK